MFRFTNGPGSSRSWANRLEVNTVNSCLASRALRLSHVDDCLSPTPYLGILCPKRGGTRAILNRRGCSAGSLDVIRSPRIVKRPGRAGGRNPISSIPISISASRNPGVAIMFSPLFRVQPYMSYMEPPLHKGGRPLRDYTVVVATWLTINASEVIPSG